MSTFINEPLVQKLPAFYNFMGGLGPDSFLRSVNSLNKLFDKPKHWRGTKIKVVDRSQAVAYGGAEAYDYLYCTHIETTHQDFERGDSVNVGPGDLQISADTQAGEICDNCGAWRAQGESEWDISNATNICLDRSY